MPGGVYLRPLNSDLAAPYTCDPCQERIAERLRPGRGVISITGRPAQRPRDGMGNRGERHRVLQPSALRSIRICSRVTASSAP